MEKIDQLRAVIGKLSENDQSFARSLIRGHERYRSFSQKQAVYVDKLIARANGEGPRKVGDMAGILALFDRAKKHLKYPAIVLGVPELGPDVSIRVNVAGARAKIPGSLTVVDGNKDDDGERSWLGRILLDGVFMPSNECIDSLAAPAIGKRLAEFAANPSRVAGEHGRLTGRCCFCRIRLTDERSTAVGYGATCAKNFGLEYPAKVAARAKHQQWLEWPVSP